ncbi:MAG: DMT family transporter [Eubacterium sp.]
MSKKIRNSTLLVLTALIWGIAFVAQSEGGDAIGPYSFNCIRSIIGSAVLMPVIIVLDKLGLSTKRPKTKDEKRKLLIGGLCCGLPLFFATNLQQLGIYLGTGAGKAGFLTACYILIVPLLGLFFKRKCGWNIWIGVVVTVIGLYQLCMKEGLSVQASDILLVLCAILFAIQIMMVDKYSPVCDGVRLSCIQFMVTGILGLIPTFFIDMKHSVEGIIEWAPALMTLDAWIPILYAGIFSCGVAYTLQIIGQDGINPTVASMLMSLESVFSVIAGAVLLHERMSSRELFGCALIFTAIVLAQLPINSKSI